METLELMKLYAYNLSNVYLYIEVLQNQLIKRFEKGKEVNFEHLVKCSSMYNIARLTAKEVFEFDNKTASRQDKQNFRIWLSKYLIEDAKGVSKL